jgi:DNA invertase Pin-like site-specific DNA recombinase
MTPKTLQPSKITSAHLQRQALISIRQSSPQQVRSNHESQERQYALVQRATALGWTPETIDTIDDDQGRSGTSAVHRPGFKKLLADISAGQVGIVLALEASRLARSSADWHRLVEICSITRTLLADDGAVYDPREPNDRLLLGVKGTISEAELFTLRCRLHEGRWNKARRGALMRSLPVGYVATGDGTIRKDPDRQVQGRIPYVFRLFTRLRVARKILVQLRTEDLKLPTQVWGGPQHGQVVWKAPTLSALVRLLHNPTYAGVYVYGQCAYDPFARSATTGKAKTPLRPLEEWPVCLPEAFPAYISWDQFVGNQRVLRANWYRADPRGAPRKGAALLQGVVFCGRCGRKMGIQHYATREKRAPAYTCYQAYHAEGGASCQCMSAHGVDAAVTALFLQAVSPAKVDIALRALQELEHERAAAREQWALQLQHADYEVQVAQRRYETVDPANRLVAGELEAQWEAALKHREGLTRRSREFAHQQEREIGPKECDLIQELAADMERVWCASTTTMEDRKTLLRYLVKRVYLDGVTETGRIQIEVEWHTGAHTSTLIERPVVGAWAPRTPLAVEQRIQALLPTHTQTQIAQCLNAEGFRSAKGKGFNYRTVRYILQSRGWQVQQKAPPTGSM